MSQVAGAPSRREFFCAVGLATGALATAAVIQATDAAAAVSPPEMQPCSKSEKAWQPFKPSAQAPTPEVHQTLSLDGIWEVSALPVEAAGEAGYRTYSTSTGERPAAQVPGEIHLDLMRAGKIDDPDVGDSARARAIAWKSGSQPS